MPSDNQLLLAVLIKAIILQQRVGFGLTKFAVHFTLYPIGCYKAFECQMADALTKVFNFNLSIADPANFKVAACEAVVFVTCKVIAIVEVLHNLTVLEVENNLGFLNAFSVRSLLLDLDNKRVTAISSLSLKDRFENDGPLSAMRKLEDLEAVSVTPDGFVYATTSFSRDKDGEVKRNRNKLVRFRVKDDEISQAAIRDDLIDFFAGISPAMYDATNHRNADSSRSFNIEGLAYDPQRQHLLIGLRSPLLEGKAPIIRLENPESILSDNDDPSLSQPLLLDLGGGGIRGMTFDRQLGGFLIISGPSGNEDNVFRVWFWEGSASKKPKLLKIKKGNGLDRAEGITPIDLGGNKFLMFVYDNGSAKKGKGGSYRFLEYDNLQIAK